MVLSEPREFANAFFQRFFPGQRDDRGGDDKVEEETTHSNLGLVVTLALRVEPVLFSLLVGVVDVPGERCWRRRGRCRWNRRLVLPCRSREMMPDDRRFTDPFFKRLL